jgi:hypothetical protein
MPTNATYDDFQKTLPAYSAHPMPDGDAVLLLDGKVCLEIERLATEWDDQLRRNISQILRQTARQVVVAIARRDQELLPSDFQLWRDLHAELRDSEVELLPVRALPAA